jgi:hypothetical protein
MCTWRGGGGDGVCVNEVSEFTEGERGTACRACRIVGIIGTAGVRFDARITTEVAWFTGVRQVTINTLGIPAGLPQGIATGTWSLSKQIGQSST